MRTINDIRADIAELKAQRAQLVAAPPPRAALREHARAVLTAAAADEASTLQRALRFPERGDGFRLRAPIVHTNIGERVDVTGLLVALLGVEAVLKALDAHVKALPDGPTDAARADGLAKIDAGLLILEHEEESAIEALEAAGATVGRRPDARPEVVLRVRADL